MLEILNEKSRECSQLKAENGRLLQNAEEEKARALDAEAEMEKYKVRKNISSYMHFYGRLLRFPFHSSHLVTQSAVA